jgi:hypothetical protein
MLSYICFSFNAFGLSSGRSHSNTRSVPYPSGAWRKESKSTDQRKSKRDPLYLIERDLIAAAILEPDGAGGFMAGHVLRDLQLASVPQAVGDFGGSERTDLKSHLMRLLMAAVT